MSSALSPRLTFRHFFVDPAMPVAPQLAILAANFIAASVLTGSLLAVLAGQARDFLSGDRLKWIDYLSGDLIVLARVWLAWPRG